ncbi:MAG TPA: 23S rRNA (guanosine(2251)-2'-O)-methyltransferase RlmB [Anseongella sp.]
MKRNSGMKKRPGGMRIFGIRAVMEAIEAGKEIESLYVQKGIEGNLYRDLRKIAGEYEVPLQMVPPEKLHYMGDKNHQGVVAFISPVIFNKLEQLIPSVYEQGQVPLILILDRITDVRNFGAICRSAECMGAHGIVIPRKGSAQVNEDAVKTSAGALLNLPLCRERNLKDSIAFLRESGLQVIACTEKTEKYPSATDLTGPTALILGSEEDGISGEYIKLADELIRIPMVGSIASLNVSVSAGIVLYEVVRQRIFVG